jgi:hypothetical protein
LLCKSFLILCCPICQSFLLGYIKVLNLLRVNT